jgi:hypothetical protein
VVILRGLAINGGNSITVPSSGAGVSIQNAATVTIENCRIQNFSGSGGDQAVPDHPRYRPGGGASVHVLALERPARATRHGVGQPFYFFHIDTNSRLATFFI